MSTFATAIVTRSAARIRRSSLSSADYSDLHFAGVHPADRACLAFGLIFMEACMQCEHTSVLFNAGDGAGHSHKRFLACILWPDKSSGMQASLQAPAQVQLEAGRTQILP